MIFGKINEQTEQGLRNFMLLFDLPEELEYSIEYVETLSDTELLWLYDDVREYAMDNNLLQCFNNVFE